MKLRQLFPLAVMVAIPACATKAQDTGKRAEQEPVAVTLVPLQITTLKRTVPVVGTLDPYKDITLATKVDGRVVRVAHDNGDIVYPGDTLLVLDSSDFILDVQVARAGFEAELERINQSVKTTLRARAALNLAEKEFARVKDERQRGIASEQAYDKAEAEVELAKAATEVAEAEANVLQANARKMAAILGQAEQRLRDSVLVAPVPEEWAAWAAAVGPAFTPFRYRIAQRMVWEGEMVRSMPEKNTFRLIIDHALKLRAAVPQQYATEVMSGQMVEVRVDAYPDRIFTGIVARVNPTVDTQNRTFGVEIIVANHDPLWRIKSGTFAKAEIRIREDSGVHTVPPEAVVSFAGVTKLFVVEGDRAKAIEIQLGQRDKTWIEVIGPVPPGAHVITSGFSQLVDGSPIRIRDAN